MYVTWLFLSKLLQIGINVKCFHFSHAAFIHEQKSQPNTNWSSNYFSSWSKRKTHLGLTLYGEKKSKLVFCMLYSVCLIPDALTQCTLAYPLIMDNYLWMLSVEGKRNIIWGLFGFFFSFCFSSMSLCSYKVRSPGKQFSFFFFFLVLVMLPVSH